MSEDTPLSGLSGLSEALAALGTSRPDYEQVRLALEEALEQSLPAPTKSLLLRTLAATYAALGDWMSARNAANTAYEEAKGQKPLNVGLLIEATYTYITVLERADLLDVATATMRATLEIALPYATPRQQVQLLEMRATLAMRRIAPSPS